MVWVSLMHLTDQNSENLELNASNQEEITSELQLIFADLRIVAQNLWINISKLARKLVKYLSIMCECLVPCSWV